MPGRSGVTAPITPDSRTTGTTAAPRRNFAGNKSFSLSIEARQSRAITYLFTHAVTSN